MCAPLPHNNTLDDFFAAGAGKICAAKNLQLIFVAAAAAGHRIKIGCTGAQRSAQIFQTPFQHPRDSQSQCLDFRCRQGGCYPTGMQFCLPQGFIDINIAEAGDKRLVQQ